MKTPDCNPTSQRRLVDPSQTMHCLFPPALPPYGGADAQPLMLTCAKIPRRSSRSQHCEDHRKPHDGISTGAITAAGISPHLAPLAPPPCHGRQRSEGHLARPDAWGPGKKTPPKHAMRQHQESFGSEKTCIKATR